MSRATLHLGDCLDVMRGMEPESVDAIVCDPPSGIGFMGRTWDHDRGGRSAWIAWHAARLAECHRLARPGARALVWALPRTSHWTGTAVEDAGWKIEDRVSHLFGQGFPKHKSKLKPACEDWWLAIKPAGKAVPLNIDGCRIAGNVPQVTQGVTRRALTGEAIHGQGHDLRRVPQLSNPSPAGRYPSNIVFSHAPGCREVGTKKVKGDRRGATGGKRQFDYDGVHCYGESNHKNGDLTPAYGDADGTETVTAWECVENCPVAELDRQSGNRPSKDAASQGGRRQSAMNNAVYGQFAFGTLPPGRGDSGGASRFFATFKYCGKATRADRGPGNTHPTVKPHELMRWLCRLITPPGGLILDPFMGSGSTGLAALAEGFRFVGIERDPGYFAIAEARVRLAEAVALA